MYEILDDDDLANTIRLKKEFEASVVKFEKAPLNGVDPRLRKAEIDSLKSQIEDFVEQIKTYGEKQAVKKLTDRSFKNIDLLKKADWCMCYSCVKRFKFEDIVEFADGKMTAMCPKCNMDSVLDDVDRDVIVELHDHSFCFSVDPVTGGNCQRIRENPFKKGEDWS